MKKEKLIKEYYKIYGELINIAYYLTDYGWNDSIEIAWDFNYVYDAVKMLEKKNIPILGGDVCIIKDKKLVYTYDNWDTSKVDNSENTSTFERAIRYINDYICIMKIKNMDISNYLFIITCDFEFLKNDDSDVLYIH